MVIWKK